MTYGTQGNTTGYSEYNDNPLPRDCVDIAVKIVFEINEQQKVQSIDLNMIEQNVFSQISNKKKLNVNVVTIDNTFIRELQSSSVSERRKAKQCLGDQDTQLIAPRMKNEMRNLVNIKAVFDAYNFLKQNTDGVVLNLSSKKK